MRSSAATETHDLCKLEDLTEKAISKCIQERYRQGIFYTYIGDAVVAVNPCREVAIYNNEYHRRYKNTTTKTSEAPHIFWTAGEALANIRARHESSCIIVGGISGAGKTVSTKLMLEHILIGEGSDGTSLAEKLKMSNPVLEMFGNAQTALNDNSSRFAKLMTLGYTANGTLVGADIQYFTLEKSRVIYQQRGERNFHIFYDMLAAMSREQLDEYNINVAEEYRILDGWRPSRHIDSRRFSELRRALDDIGIKNQMLKDMYHILAAILLLTNVRFQEDGDGHAVISQADRNRSIRPVCDMLGSHVEELETALRFRTFITPRDGSIVSPKTVSAAGDGRDALAKYLYSRLFDGIVSNLNTTMVQLHPGGATQSLQLGILDISGFEKLPETNGFEQLLINITNESMHQSFLEYVCRREQELYLEEGITWQHVQFEDNKKVLDLLIEHHPSLMSLLEDTNQQSSDDRKFVVQLNKGCSGSSVFVQGRNTLEFGIRHYAGEKWRSRCFYQTEGCKSETAVTYSAEGFVDKNADTLPEALKGCLRCSNYFLRDLHSEQDKVGKLHTYVSTGFKKSLKELTNTLQGMKPLFVRCVTPNKGNRPGNIDCPFLEGQLWSAGVMDVTRIRKHGYPSRYSFSDFVTRYAELLGDDYISPDSRTETHIILGQEKIGSSLYQLGDNKVFLKEPAVDILDQRLKQKRLEAEQAKQKLSNPDAGNPDSNTTSAYSSLTPSPYSSIRKARESTDLSASPLPTKIGIDEEPEVNTEEQSTLSTESDNDGVDGGDDTDKTPTKAYDMFRETEEDMEDEANECEQRFLKICRFMIYIFIFLILVATGVIVHGCFLALVARFQLTDGTEKIEQANKLMLCVGIPPAITLLTSLLSVVFGRIQSLPIKFLIPILIVEGLQTFGTAGLVYKVLPFLDSFLSSVLMLAVGVVPSMLSLIEMLSQRSKKCSLRCFMATVSCLTFLIQVASPCVLILVELDKQSFLDKVWLVGALVLISLGWWENFLHGKIAGFDFSKFGRRLDKSRQKVNVFTSLMKIGTIVLCSVFLVENHSFVFNGQSITERVPVNASVSYIPSISSNTSKVIAYICRDSNRTRTDECAAEVIGNNQTVDLVTYICSEFNGRNIDNCTFEGDSEIGANMRTYECRSINKTNVDNCSIPLALKDSDTASSNDSYAEFVQVLIDNALIIAIVIASIIFYNACILACSLYMQILAFCIPVTILVPLLSLGFVYMKCVQLPIVHDLFTYDLICPATDITTLTVPLAVAGALWFSLILLTWYIWIPNYERMANIESIFKLPALDCIMPHTNMMMRRKYDERKHQRKSAAHTDIDAPDNGNVGSINKHTHGDNVDSKTDVPNSVPKVFICATMWHETRQEMTQLLKSLFRIDLNCAAREFLSKKYKRSDPDKYEPEIHIIVDDAFKDNKKSKQRVPNGYIMQLIDCIKETARLFISEDEEWSPFPKKATLPYGGRLSWTLPGGTKMVVHMKDKAKIRNRKRWSQIMYMYYLLGFKMFGNKSEKDVTANGKSAVRRRVSRNVSLFKKLPSDLRDKLSNTFLLTLDGDVDFQPGSVRLLIDRMKKNNKVGAVCGRIHPIGSGPMIWYQQFEYAVGHWLQKAAEHVLGCVLCCPGCFSLFRANAIMDDNVLRTYTTPPTEPKHFIQFEQGEDRWLCTLLLQQGYKIDYCAGADALTFAPETFNEFFIQRRRWSPSTMANIMDLLASWRNTIRKNDNISSFYMLYQFLLMLTSLLAPATVALLIAGAYASVLSLDTKISYYVSIAPILGYIIICLKCKSDTQLKVAAFLSSIYCIIMIIVTIGTILNIIEDDLFSPNVLFLVVLAAIFTITAFCHPKEFSCVLHGLLYYITVPSTFIFLTVYFMANINNVSWGTRENKSNGSEASKKRKVSRVYEKVLNVVGRIMKIDFSSQVLEDNEEGTVQGGNNAVENGTTPRSGKYSVGATLNDRFWMGYKYFNQLNESSEGDSLAGKDEEEFWNDIIKKYLMPINTNIKHEQALKEELDVLRNNVVFGFFLLNLMFSIALFQLQLNRDRLTGFFIFGKYEPVSVIFLASFLLILIAQFTSMLIHRLGTFLHLIASTSLVQRETEDFDYALNHTKKLIHPDVHQLSTANNSEMGEIEPDYGESDSDAEERNDYYPDESAYEYGRRHDDDRSRVQHHAQGNAYRSLFRRNFESLRRRSYDHEQLRQSKLHWNNQRHAHRHSRYRPSNHHSNRYT